MYSLYPDVRPYVAHSLPVGGGHTLHVEECGNPRGLPVVFLHGGPGAGCQPFHRAFFDPTRYRVVLLDQRGCGRSSPHAELAGNDTTALISDIEAVRKHLHIERWVVFGGSWGATLALVYAQQHPDRVRGLIVRGVFLCRPRDLHWFYQDGASRLFPDHWEALVAPIPQGERGNLVQAYYRRLAQDDNEVARMATAKAWSLWEARTASLLPQESVIRHFTDPYTALALARIEAHFFVHHCFLEPDQILRDAPRLAEIPGVIVQGRYDAICPCEGAWALHQAWPGSELVLVPDAGHAAGEPGITSALVKATMDMAERLA
jgi:proline iminopeptidase